MNWVDTEPWFIDSIDLLRLRRLEVRDPYVLKYLKVPNLRSLRVDVTINPNIDWFAPVYYFPSIFKMLTANPSCALDSFTCTGAPYIFHLTKALQMMPSLTVLRLLDIPYELGILQCLTASSVNSHVHGTLVPKLEVLTLAFSSNLIEEHPTEFEGSDALVRSVDSRCKPAQSASGSGSTSSGGSDSQDSKGVTRLRQFYLTVECLGERERFPERVKERFAEMEKAGLSVILESRRAGMPMHPLILADRQSQRCII